MRAPAILRSPVVHFLLLGALAFAARDALRALGEHALVLVAAPPRITLDAARIDALRRGWQAETGRPPTRAELDRLIEHEVDDELLYREALARGLDADDPGIALRLVQKMTFLEEAAGEARAADPAELLRRARALGLEREDEVVRRWLIQKLRLGATALAPDERPTEAELVRAYAERQAALREPERRHLVHVFLGRDRRGDRLEAEAAALHERLEREAIPPGRVPPAGDAFALGPRFERTTQAELARTLGEGFAAEAFALAPGRWSPPIASAYGLHLVRV